MTYDLEKEVIVDLDEAIGNDIEGWNDYLCELTGEPCLQDIQWEVVGTKGSGIRLLVTGYVEDDE